MKCAILITGMLRQFYNNLYKYLIELEEYIDYDLYIYTSSSNLDKNYLHTTLINESDSIQKNKRCKLFFIDNTNIENLEGYKEREKNIFYQWYKLNKCFSYVKDEYDFILRIRPDINISLSPKSFYEIIHNLRKDTLYIPTGNDRLIEGGINDQFAIGSYSIMQQYCNLYNELNAKAKKPFISERILFEYLQHSKISVQRIQLPYTLYLSDCILLAITGDSGSGKSTLLTAIQKVFPFDSKLLIETDRYHKWERNNENWKQITHLHPEANYLEKLEDDTFHLKLGNTVCTVDYDHTTGKFTAAQTLEPKNVIILCGLHTLYKEKLRNEIDIRIYVNTESNLKKYWKVKRDLKKRKYTLEKILETIEKRKNDFTNYIEPQKEYANIILHYWYDSQIPDYSKELNPSALHFAIECNTQLLSYISPILYFFSLNSKKTEKNTIIFTIKQNIHQSDILKFMNTESIQIESNDQVDSGYLGVLQLVILKLLFN